MNTDNPYSTPDASLVATGDEDQSRAIRTSHLDHEANIRAIGLLYFVGAVLLMLVGGLFLIISLPEGVGVADSPEPSISVGLSLLYLFLGLVQLGLGIGMRRLSPWVKFPAGFFSVLGLLAVPVGTIINGLILYLLFCAKGRFVLSHEYQRVLAATPDMKPTTPVWVWLLLGLFVVLIGSAVLLPTFGS